MMVTKWRFGRRTEFTLFQPSFNIAVKWFGNMPKSIPISEKSKYLFALFTMLLERESYGERSVSAPQNIIRFVISGLPGSIYSRFVFKKKNVKSNTLQGH